MLCVSRLDFFAPLLIRDDWDDTRRGQKVESRGMTSGMKTEERRTEWARRKETTWRRGDTRRLHSLPAAAAFLKQATNNDFPSIHRKENGTWVMTRRAHGVNIHVYTRAEILQTNHLRWFHSESIIDAFTCVQLNRYGAELSKWEGSGITARHEHFKHPTRSTNQKVKGWFKGKVLFKTDFLSFTSCYDVIPSSKTYMQCFLDSLTHAWDIL